MKNALAVLILGLSLQATASYSKMTKTIIQTSSSSEQISDIVAKYRPEFACVTVDRKNGKDHIFMSTDGKDCTTNPEDAAKLDLELKQRIDNSNDPQLKHLLQMQKKEIETINHSFNTFFTNDQLDRVWTKIAELAQKKNLSGREYWMMDYVWKSLRQQNKIRRLSKRLRDDLNIPEEYCSTKDTCSKLKAVYLPLNNMILVDFGSMDQVDILKFYHELVHAIQYTFRLPLDLQTLYENSKKKDGISASRIVDLLRFLYEAQANWYTIRISDDERWSSGIKSLLVLTPAAIVKVFFAMMTATATVRVGQEQLTDWLPEFDIPNEGKYLHFKSSKAIEIFHEPIIVNHIFNLFNPGVNIDIDVHVLFSKIVERAYFGELNFIRQDNGSDQTAFVEMNNNFHNKVLSPRDLIGCDSLLRNVAMSDSPLLQWLTLPRDAFIGCASYTEDRFFKNREVITKLVTDPRKWRFYHKGTEGGHGPSLNIDPQGTEGGHGPSLEIHPQLEILPE